MNGKPQNEILDEEENAPPKQPPKGHNLQPTKFLPTDRIKFGRQLDLLRAYAAASGFGGQPVTNADVAKLVEMRASTVSIANAFFSDNGFLQKSESGYMPSADVIAYTRAYEWNPETAAQKLAPLLGRTWFFRALEPALSFRKLRVEEAITHLAEACSAPKEYEGRLATLLEYLQAGGLIIRENGELSLMKGTPQPVLDKPAEPKPPDAREASASRTGTIHIVGSPQATAGVVQFHVSVRVDMAEFAGWNADRITAFFGGIAQVLAAKRGMGEDEGAE